MSGSDNGYYLDMYSIIDKRLVIKYMGVGLVKSWGGTYF